MFRNQYDSDVTLWSPQGRLFQVEYAMEAVNQGTVTVGLKSEDFAVLVGLHRPYTEMGVLQPKILSIDSHVGISLSGLSSDARQLASYLRTECTAFRHSYDTTYPVSKLVKTLGNKMQANTQRYDRRPYGVGLLLAGYDEVGSHIWQIMPSANVFNCKAMAIGSRAQSARTYLDRFKATFPFCSKDELICHGIQSIHQSHFTTDEMRVSIGVVGKEHPFKILTNEEVESYQRFCLFAVNPDSSQDTEIDENQSNQSI
ncbi:proteasome subunit alpha type-1 [Drosophila grimshawi]|uniref:Proteasome subunit alpha type n=1 Tax=Drosophila grimshawi TaxID=7222 RepID=B4JAY6_DROGR|nr:proteasome subunit alpha type-1 [Drosophila grimshawi]EDW02856.1 GH10812 [Drosophila grimshawi]